MTRKFSKLREGITKKNEKIIGKIPKQVRGGRKKLLFPKFVFGFFLPSPKG